MQAQQLVSETPARFHARTTVDRGDVRLTGLASHCDFGLRHAIRHEVRDDQFEVHAQYCKRGCT